jgi:Na+/H+ antiporter NhaD/arsenite permease-like protein
VALSVFVVPVHLSRIFALVNAAARRGIRIDWRRHARTGVPVTLATLAICAASLWWRMPPAV